MFYYAAKIKRNEDGINESSHVCACKYACFHIDETGSHQHDLHHEQGCGLSGAAPVSLKFHIRGKRIPAIAANTMRGVEDYYLVECSVITSMNTFAAAY